MVNIPQCICISNHFIGYIKYIYFFNDSSTEVKNVLNKRLIFKIKKIKNPVIDILSITYNYNCYFDGTSAVNSVE